MIFNCNIFNKLYKDIYLDQIVSQSETLDFFIFLKSSQTGSFPRIQLVMILDGYLSVVTRGKCVVINTY